METTESQESLWMLHCKNEKCRAFFDYCGRLPTENKVQLRARPPSFCTILEMVSPLRRRGESDSPQLYH